MRTTCYHLAFVGTVFAAGMGQLNIVRPGRIVGARMVWSGIAGAGTFGGNASLYLNQNAINDTLTNNPPRETYLGLCIVAWSAAAAAFTSSSGAGFVPMNVPIIQGDMLTMNGGNAGAAAPANSNLLCDVLVAES